MTTTFLLVRHAVTADVDLRLSGRRPGVALSEAGRAQAAALGAGLAGAGIDAIVASPLDRTRETAEAIGWAAGVAVSTDDAALEIDVGDWTGVGFSQLAGDPRWQAWNDERATARCPGGESMVEVQARIVGLIRRLAAGGAGRTIALVTHADLIRAAVCDVLGLGLANIHRFDIDPASVTRVVAGDWGARVLRMNERVR
ncbi:MAG: histidine phosphatase family protein [Janthinobacterium lividum]